MLHLLVTLVVSALPASPVAAPTCPEPAPAVADFGECDDAAPPDLWYRMSRFADSEPGGLAAAPTRRQQSNRSASSCEAPQVPAQLSAPQLPPAALFALPGLLPLHLPSHFDGDARDLPARALAPPERPPRV